MTDFAADAFTADDLVLSTQGNRRSVSTGTPYEASVGYSRAVRVGNWIAVAGTTAIDAQGNIASADPYQQAVYCLQKIAAALRALDAGMEHVVRTRLYVVNMQDAQRVTQAHHEFFQQIRPASTLVEVSRLASAEMLVEIEADAIVER